MATDFSYLGNPNLRKLNVKIEYTPEQVAEYAKCATDPVYFIETYVKIISIDAGIIPFKMYEFQKNMVRSAVENRFCICKIPRQMGKTTAVCAILLWYVLFHENFSVAVLAHKAKGAYNVMKRVQLAYENLPKWLQQGISEWNKGSIALENGSSMFASATTISGLRSESISFVYMDEFAIVPHNLQVEFYTSTYPVITSSKTAKLFITSTPKGLNLFYTLWKESEEGRNNFKRISVHWSDVPGRDEAWKQETIRNTSAEQFSVEFECEFLGSANTLIHPDILQKLVYSTPIFKNENSWVYAHPDPLHQYVIVADTARGAERDYSAFIVVDISTSPYQIVALWRSNLISPLLYPQFIYEFAKGYNNAFVLVEINDIGGQVADILVHEYEYENLFRSVAKGWKGQQIGTSGSSQSQLGVRTTTSVKRIGCSNFKSLVESEKIILNDENLREEIFHFIAVRNSYEAEDGFHDDLVMCCVLFSWLVNQDYFKEISASDVRRRMAEENEQYINDSILPLGFTYTGGPEIDLYAHLPPTSLFDEIQNMKDSWEDEDEEFDKWFLNGFSKA